MPPELSDDNVRSTVRFLGFNIDDRARSKFSLLVGFLDQLELAAKFGYLFICDALVKKKGCSSDELDSDVFTVVGRVLTAFRIVLSGLFGVEVGVPAFNFDAESKFTIL